MRPKEMTAGTEHKYSGTNGGLCGKIRGSEGANSGRRWTRMATEAGLWKGALYE